MLYSNYIRARDDLAYLSYFRRKITFNKEILEECGIKKKEKKDKLLTDPDDSHKKLNEENDDSLQTYMNLLLCTKYRNSGKLSSHNWFFNGYCKELRPKYAVLLDVGLKTDG
jgi:cellulose synthase/poly-beta-1,6-N-acetylglucosamine synthase-like glycosyltransferase